MKNKSTSELLQIPGIGPSICQDLHEIGIFKINDLVGQSPQSLYDRLCQVRNAAIDRCVLYVFRCAVYFAENKQPDPELLKWWRWKDQPDHRK